MESGLSAASFHKAEEMEDVDRLSSLPLDVRRQILCKLETDEAVRTSILSTCWRSSWRSAAQHIRFNNLYRPQMGPRSDREPWSPRQRQPKSRWPLEVAVNQVLALKTGATTTFELDAEDVDGEQLEWWLYLLSIEGVEGLKLSFHKSERKRLPRHLFKCFHLLELRLQGCEIWSPDTWHLFSPGFVNLKVLELREVDLSLIDYEKYFRRLPSLESLHLSGIEEILHLDLDLPRLRRLYIFSPFQTLEFKNCPSLESARIETTDPESASRRRWGLDQCLGRGGLLAVKRLHFCQGFLRRLSRTPVPESLSKPLEHLGELSLMIDFSSVRQTRLAICLLRSSPRLKTLCITEIIAVAGEIDQEKMAQEYSFCHLEKLRSYNLSARGLGMSFLGFVLQAAPALRTVCLRLAPCTREAGIVKSAVLSWVIQFISPAANVTVLD